jgi:hypothetical protein
MTDRPSYFRGLRICNFASLDDLPAKSHGDSAAVLAALKPAGRFSIFDVTPRLATTLDSLTTNGRIRNTGAGEYPWVYVEAIDL